EPPQAPAVVAGADHAVAAPHLQRGEKRVDASRTAGDAAVTGEVHGAAGLAGCGVVDLREPERDVAAADAVGGADHQRSAADRLVEVDAAGSPTVAHVQQSDVQNAGLSEEELAARRGRLTGGAQADGHGAGDERVAGCAEKGSGGAVEVGRAASTDADLDNRDI